MLHIWEFWIGGCNSAVSNFELFRQTSKTKHSFCVIFAHADGVLAAHLCTFGGVTRLFMINHDKLFLVQKKYILNLHSWHKIYECWCLGYISGDDQWILNIYLSGPKTKEKVKETTKSKPNITPYPNTLVSSSEYYILFLFLVILFSHELTVYIFMHQYTHIALNNNVVIFPGICNKIRK